MSRVRSVVGRARRAAKRRLRELTTEREVPIADLSAPIVPTETASPVVTPFETYFTSEHTIRLREEWRDAEPTLAESAYFETHVGRFAYLMRCVESIGVSGRCLDVAGTSMTKLLFETLGPLESVSVAENFDVELDDWADRFGVGTYDLVIYSEVIEHLAADPAKSLHEINRSLKLGGYLILTTVNIGSELGIYSLANGEAPYAMGNIFGVHRDRHQREYASSELQRLVGAHGFRSWVTTENVYAPAMVKEQAHEWMAVQAGFNPEYHGDTIVVVAQKVIDSTAPYWLYPVYHSSVSENSRGHLPADLLGRLEHSWPW